MKPLTACRLYTFIDTAYLHGRKPEALARALCDGGSDLIQLRAKHSTPEEVFRLAQAIAPVVERAGVGLVINDFPDVARAVGAPICHLGQEDFFEAGYQRVEDLQAKLSPAGVHPRAPLIIGLSSHSSDQAERAIAAGAAYLGVGPVFPTGTKPEAVPVTLAYVRWAAARVRLPWFAIGGINLENLDQVLAAGATRICVVSAILNAEDVAGTCQRFKERLTSAAQSE